MIEITRESFTEAMEKAVAERGEDFVYPDSWRDPEWGTCQYYVEGVGAACIIGKALDILGVDVSLLNGSVYNLFIQDLHVPDEKLRVAMGEAQAVQDAWHPWGKALAKYKEVLGDE